jgi:hypothetical protein
MDDVQNCGSYINNRLQLKTEDRMQSPERCVLDKRQDSGYYSELW